VASYPGARPVRAGSGHGCSGPGCGTDRQDQLRGGAHHPVCRRPARQGCGPGPAGQDGAPYRTNDL